MDDGEHDDMSGTKLPISAIVGGVVGGVVGLVAIAVLLLYICVYRRRKQRKAMTPVQPYRFEIDHSGQQSQEQQF